MTRYVLRGGDEGAGRLQLLARVKWPTTKALLRRAGLEKGMRCLDVGCGGGAVTLELARWVGPKGRAVGLDMDERALELARQEARRRGLPARFRSVTAADLDEKPVYDLVFARFLLTHLTEPGATLERMVRAARPGGTVVLEDIDFPGSFCHPPCVAFERYVELYQEAVRQRGADPAIGPRLLGLCTAAGLEDLHLDVIVPTFFEGEGKLMASVTMAHIRESVHAAGLATPAEIDTIVANLEAFAAAPLTVMSLPRIFQVWGRRPPRCRRRRAPS